jgi:hypothetical protein
MRTALTLEAEWRQILRESMSTGAKEDESSTGRVWAAGFHYVTARSRLKRFLKVINRLFLPCIMCPQTPQNKGNNDVKPTI